MGSDTNTTELHSLLLVVNPITSVHDNVFVNDPISVAEISFRNIQLNVFIPNSMSDNGDEMLLFHYGEHLLIVEYIF